MYKDKTLVVFGVSQDPSKYGYKIFVTLLAQGLTVYGINPKGGQVEGRSLYTQLADLPARADIAIMVIPPSGLQEAVGQCIRHQVREIWFQPGARSAEAYQMAAKAQIRAVDGCFMAENGFW
ncbi:MAG: CoA-binding protein [Elusimicrobiaceae bacterium]|nr:CoA-binding protein [Elusimicrobiaceae bacterium]